MKLYTQQTDPNAKHPRSLPEARKIECNVNAQKIRPVLPVTDPAFAVIGRPCPAETDNLQVTVRVLAHFAQGG